MWIAGIDLGYHRFDFREMRFSELIYLGSVREDLHQFEKVLLIFFSRVSTATQEKYPVLLRQLQADIFAGMDENDISNALDYQNFKEWLASKLNSYSGAQE